MALGLAVAACGGVDGEEGSTAGGRDEPDAVGAVVLSPDAERATAAGDAPVADWVAGVNDAGWRFHRTLEGNAVSSPTSIGLAFSFARGGASPGTGEMLDEIFGFPAGEANHDAANAVSQALAGAGRGTTTLETANRLFVVDGFEVNQDFVDLGARSYGAGVATMPGDAEGKAAVVNEWVDETTRGLIPQIVTSELMAPVLVELVNAVYLKADWLHPFHPGLTADEPFTNGDGTEVDVPFMGWEEPVAVPYADLGEAEAVGLPYEDGDLTMWLVVPTADDGLAGLEESLDAEDLASLGDRATATSLDLSLPTWEAELGMANLLDWLGPEGLRGASFGGIAPGLELSHAVHGAKIVVDEEGTEAAAATALGFRVSATEPASAVEVVADHPFLWALVHEPTDSIVFTGRVTDPS
ncbi:MAG: serpin family protein [Actinomycetota bacterium]|nr:serpin family protein [Actinomycetota bacterium]